MEIGESVRMSVRYAKAQFTKSPAAAPFGMVRKHGGYESTAWGLQLTMSIESCHRCPTVCLSHVYSILFKRQKLLNLFARSHNVAESIT